MRILGFLVIVGLLISILFSLTSNDKDGVIQSASAGSIDKGEVEEIVASYIRDNPKALIDSLNSYQQIKAEEDRMKAIENIASKSDQIKNNPNDPVAGNKDGDVVLVEFYDYSCGYCKKVFPYIAKLIEEDKNLKIVFKEFPILGPNSLLASKAALAVNNIAPEKYLEMHEKLMNNRFRGKDAVVGMAVDLGIDKEKLLAEMDSDKVKEIIEENKNLARDLGVSGTPAFIIGDEFVPGAIELDQIREIIKEQREKNNS